MKSIYEDYNNKEKLQKNHDDIIRLICEDDSLLHEVVHVYICAAFGADTNPEITEIKLK